jgi:Domain of unknown function (DUF4136)
LGNSTRRKAVKARGLVSLTAILAINLGLGVSTQAQTVKVDYDRGLSFQVFKTYAWTAGTPAKNSLWDQRIIDGVDKELAAKGFRKVEVNSDPDLLVLYHAAVGQQAELNTTSMGGWGWRWGGGMATTTIERIPVGQLTVDIGDAKTKKLVWMGSSSDTLSDDPDKNQKKLQKALDKMFKKFPPPPVKQ